MLLVEMIIALFLILLYFVLFTDLVLEWQIISLYFSPGVNKFIIINQELILWLFDIFADEIGKNREVLQHMTRVPIVIRVLVTESEVPANDGGVFKVLKVEEEIIRVDGKDVQQIKVKQFVMKLDSANNELLAKREVTMIELKDSEIHKRPKESDKHQYPHGI